MKSLTSLLGLTSLYHQRNTIPEKLEVEHIVDGIQSYQTNWLQRVKRIEQSGTPRMALDYKPKGKRAIGRPKTRWKDQQNLQD